MKLSRILSISETPYVRADDDPPPYWEEAGVAAQVAEFAPRETRARLPLGAAERLRRMRARPLRLMCRTFAVEYVGSDELFPGVLISYFAFTLARNAGRRKGTRSAWPAALRLLALRRDAASMCTETSIVPAERRVQIRTANLPFGPTGVSAPLMYSAAACILKSLARREV